MTQRPDGSFLGNKGLATLGPEPLEISLEEFTERLKKRKTRMKALLLNQTFVAGIGNIYADEILYAAKVHPLAIASRLSKPRVALVHQTDARSSDAGDRTWRILDLRLCQRRRRARMVSDAA